LAPFRAAGFGVGYVPEGQCVSADPTVKDNPKVPQGNVGPYTITRIY
jgi:branched-chain amino acid transport system ATP-binding protein